MLSTVCLHKPSFACTYLAYHDELESTSLLHSRVGNADNMKEKMKEKNKQEQNKKGKNVTVGNSVDRTVSSVPINPAPPETTAVTAASFLVKVIVSFGRDAMLTWCVELWDDSDASVFGISNDVSHIGPAVDVVLGEGPSSRQLWQPVGL